ncbi:MAG: hypothetical protein WC378_04490 [Opitutaceae bacterium]|jgi:hypothetical protein
MKIVAVAEAAASRIQAIPLLGDSRIQILTERQGDLNQKITTALSKLGLSVVIVTPDVDILQHVGPEIRVNVRLVAEVSELPLVNQSATGSGVPALAAATAILKALHRAPNGLDEGEHRPRLNEFRLPEEQPLRLIPDKRNIVYHVTAYTEVII